MDGQVVLLICIFAPLIGAFFFAVGRSICTTGQKSIGIIFSSYFFYDGDSCLAKGNEFYTVKILS